jgi:hypothetical protein
MLLTAGCVSMLLSVAGAEDFRGKIAKIHVQAAPTVVKIFFKYPLEYRRTDLAGFDCIDAGDHYVRFSEEKVPLATVNQILSLALAAQSTGQTFGADVESGPNGGNWCENGVEGYLLN